MREPITVYAVSDMTGQTVTRIVRAASAQFGPSKVTIKVLQHANSAQQVLDAIEAQGITKGHCAVFHTILSKNIRKDLRNALQAMHIPSVDLLGSTAHVMADLLGERPQEKPGVTIEDGAKPVYIELT